MTNGNKHVDHAHGNHVVRYAFLKSVPIMFGYVFLGMAFGILLQQSGFNFLWAVALSGIVYAGSLQFVLVSFMATAAPLSVVALMSFLINSRHMFYGISFIKRFKSMGIKYPFMVFFLTDETYSVLVSIEVDKGVHFTEEERKSALFLASLFNYLYWLIGSVLGALLGQFIPWDLTGIDFAMTALFVVIFVEQWIQWQEVGTHIPALTGLISSAAFLFILGPSNFILPSLIVTVAALMLMRKTIEKRAEVL